MLGMSGERTWIYPLTIAGTFRRVRHGVSAFLTVLLVLVPWINIAGRPAVRIDLPGRKLYMLGGVFTAMDGFNIALLAFLAAFSLFFFTALFGRLWCGYFCPQTVFLESWIRPIEVFIEGNRAQRKKRDNGPWTFDKVWRKAAKLSIFGALALGLGMFAVSWFEDPRLLWTGQGGRAEYAIVFSIAFVFFWDWVWFREQLCIYLCPYARFQGALTDDHSLVITYDAVRGEPRKKGKASAKAGKCIDCNKCVTVCPQGIDIRDGFQLECIACGLCVDACESVMDKLGHDTLVRYSTYAIDTGGKTRLVRARTGIYATLLLGLTVLLGFRILTNEPFDVSVNRTPGSLFQVDADGHIRNTFLVNLHNTDPDDEATYYFTVNGLEGAQIMARPVHLQPGEHKAVPLVIRLPAGASRTTPFTVEIHSGEQVVIRDTTFKAPADGEGT